MVKTDKKVELVVKTDREMDAREWRVLLGRGVGLPVAGLGGGRAGGGSQAADGGAAGGLGGGG
jgi:hypothetical protein